MAYVPFAFNLKFRIRTHPWHTHSFGRTAKSPHMLAMLGCDAWAWCEHNGKTVSYEEAKGLLLLMMMINLIANIQINFTWIHFRSLLV